MTVALSFGLVLLAGVLCFWGGVLRDLGRRAVAYKQSTVTESAELLALRARCDVLDKAVATLAKDFRAALDTERERVTKLESERAARLVGRSVENTTAWRR